MLIDFTLKPVYDTDIIFAVLYLLQENQCLTSDQAYYQIRDISSSLLFIEGSFQEFIEELEKRQLITIDLISNCQYLTLTNFGRQMMNSLLR